MDFNPTLDPNSTLIIDKLRKGLPLTPDEEEWARRAGIGAVPGTSLSKVAGVGVPPPTPLTSIGSPSPNPTEPATPLGSMAAPKLLDVSSKPATKPADPFPTDDTGKINWWTLLAPLATTAAGALIGGKTGALYGAQAGAHFLKGYTEETVRLGEQQDKLRLSDIVQKHKAENEAITRRREAARLFDSTGAETPDLDPSDKITITRAKEKEAADKEKEKPAQISTRRREAARLFDSTGAETPDLDPSDKANILREQGRKRKETEQKETGREQAQIDREHRAEERKAKQEAVKPLTDQQISTAIKDLNEEEKEIKERGVLPRDENNMPIPNSKPVFSSEDAARLQEIEEERAIYRSKRKAKSLLRSMGEGGRKLGGNGKATTEPPPTEADFMAAAKKAFEENRINPDTGFPFRNVDEARAYLYSAWQKKQVNP